jgi:hypothetical protein
MAIEVTCPTCGAVLPAPDEFAGQKIRCADCEADVDVPAAFEDSDDRPDRTSRDNGDEIAHSPSSPPANVLTGTAVAWLLVLGLLSCAGLALLGMALIPAKG